jgi:hypothetical protein
MTIYQVQPMMLEAGLRFGQERFRDDLRRLNLQGLKTIKRKYNLVSALLNVTPTAIGHAVDQLLAAHNQVGISTQIGIAASLLEGIVMKERIEDWTSSEQKAHLLSTALIVSLAVIPTGAVMAARTRALWVTTAAQIIARGERPEGEC